jgi:RNA polymerase sigma-70 factor, ECF subfamily
VEDRSFEAFYVKEYQQVLALAFVLLGDRSRAEDVTHDAFIAAFEEWDGLTNPAGWIRTVAVNAARSSWRRRYAENRALTRLESEVRVGSDLPEATDEFWGEVRKLPLRQAQVIALYYLEDRPVAEIAGLLGCGESTARVHLMRGRRTLAQRLGVGYE